MTIRGLTLGKFAPLHRGHQLVIETALGEVDDLIVLVYDASDVTSVPLPVRAGWIRRLYPGVQVVEVLGPRETGDDPDLQRRHEDCILRVLAGTRIDRFYSSEPYGEHVSRALGALDRRVDPGRVRVPTSGTAIRARPFALREWLSPEVLRDLVVRVAVVGAPCTGKTTLVQRLAQDLGAAWMPEHGREYWERHHASRRLTPAQLLELARQHAEREDALMLECDGVLLCDTNALTTLVFAKAWHGGALPGLEELADACASRYDLTFACADDFPYVSTWDRSGEGDRRAMQRRTLSELDARRIPHAILRGDVATRAAAVRRALQGFSKHGDAGAALARAGAA